MTVTTPIRDDTGADLRLDRFVDSPDASIAVHQLVDAPAPAVYAAARALDLLEVRTPLLTASFWARGLPAKVLGRPEPPRPPALTLEGELGLPGWMRLDEVPDRAHRVRCRRRVLDPHDHLEHRCHTRRGSRRSPSPVGAGSRATDTTLAYGEHRTLLTYECRTKTTDTDSRQRFLRYWWLIRPFVAHIMRATVATIVVHATTGLGATR